MTKRTGPSKRETIRTIQEADTKFQQTKAKAWKKVASELRAPSRREREVNLNKLQQMSEQEKGKVLVVLGTVLGSGEVSDAVNVYAKRFTKSAKDKIEAKKGTAKSLLELSSGKSNVKEWVMVK